MENGKLHEFQERRFYKYIASAFIVALATFIQHSVWAIVKPAPYIFYFPAVIFASIFGGGFFAILLSIICAQYFFIEPNFSFQLDWPEDFIRHVVFFLTALTLKVLVELQIKAKLEAQQSLKESQDERELREKFVSTLTHDLQTPLTTAKLAIQLLLRNSDPESIHKNGERVLFNINRIESMVRDLLDTSRIRAGKKLPLKVEEMDICLCLQSISNDLSVLHGDRFKVNAPEKIIGFWSEDAIRRIMENLCTNAIKYGSESTPVTISVEESDQTILLKVHNLGDTIPHEELELLFKPFERSRYTKEKKGWGLGLTLVKGLTEAQGGNISVTSDLDGTTFSICLPKDVRQFVEVKL